VYRHRCFDYTRSENIRRKSITFYPFLPSFGLIYPIVTRQTQAIHDRSSALRVKRTHSVLTTNPQIQVSQLRNLVIVAIFSSSIDETARITKAGGHVWGRRVNGQLPLVPI